MTWPKFIAMEMSRERGAAGRFVGSAEPRAFIQRAIACRDEQCLIWPFKRGQDGRARFNGLVCREVCAAVNGAPPFTKAEAAHACGNGHLGCVNGSHLLWKTHAGNGKDLARDGRVKGERHGMAKFTEADVRFIRASNLSNRDLAARFDVWPPAISRVRSGQRWSHIQ